MGKSFKGFSKALSLILAVAMVVTCVPTSAYAADLLAGESEDLLISNDNVAEEASDALVDASASEEKSSTSIDTQKAADLATAPNENKSGKEDFDPDTTAQDTDIAVATYVPGDANYTDMNDSTKRHLNMRSYYDANYAIVGPSATNITWASETDYKFYIQPLDGFDLVLNDSTNPLFTAQYRVKDTDTAYKASPANDVKIASSQYTVSTPDDEGRVLVTIKKGFFEDALAARTKTDVDAGTAAQVNLAITGTAKVKEATIPEPTVDTTGGTGTIPKFASDTYKAPYYANYSMDLSAAAGVTGTIDSITVKVVEEAGKDPVTLTQGTVTNNTASTWNDTTNATTWDSTNKKLWIRSSVIQDLVDGDVTDLTISVKFATGATTNELTVSVPDTEYVDYFVQQNLSSGTSLAKVEEKKDVYVAFKPAGANDRIVSDIFYAIDDGAKKSVGTLIGPGTLGGGKTWGAPEATGATVTAIPSGWYLAKLDKKYVIGSKITFSAETKEVVYAAISTGTNAVVVGENTDNISAAMTDYAVTGEAYSFSVTPDVGYKITAVSYAVGSGSAQALTVNDDNYYTIPEGKITDKVTITYTAVLASSSVKSNVRAYLKDADSPTSTTTLTGATATVKNMAGTDITNAAIDNDVTRNEYYYFKVSPAGGKAIVKVYTVDMGGSDTETLVEAKEVAEGIYRTKDKATANGDLRIYVETANVYTVTAPTNTKVTFTGADTAASGSTYTFKVEPNASSTGTVYITDIFNGGTSIWSSEAGTSGAVQQSIVNVTGNISLIVYTREVVNKSEYKASFTRDNDDATNPVLSKDGDNYKLELRNGETQAIGTTTNELKAAFKNKNGVDLTTGIGTNATTPVATGSKVARGDKWTLSRTTATTKIADIATTTITANKLATVTADTDTITVNWLVADSDEALNTLSYEANLALKVDDRFASVSLEGAKGYLVKGASQEEVYALSFKDGRTKAVQGSGVVTKANDLYAGTDKNAVVWSVSPDYTTKTSKLYYWGVAADDTWTGSASSAAVAVAEGTQTTNKNGVSVRVYYNADVEQTGDTTISATFTDKWGKTYDAATATMALADAPKAGTDTYLIIPTVTVANSEAATTVKSNTTERVLESDGNINSAEISYAIYEKQSASATTIDLSNASYNTPEKAKAAVEAALAAGTYKAVDPADVEIAWTYDNYIWAQTGDGTAAIGTNEYEKAATGFSAASGTSGSGTLYFSKDTTDTAGGKTNEFVSVAGSGLTYTVTAVAGETTDLASNKPGYVQLTPSFKVKGVPLAAGTNASTLSTENGAVTFEVVRKSAKHAVRLYLDDNKVPVSTTDSTIKTQELTTAFINGRAYSLVTIDNKVGTKNSGIQFTEIEHGTKFKLPNEDAFNKSLFGTGRTIYGWSNGTDFYACGEDITVNADTTLYALFGPRFVTSGVFNVNTATYDKDNKITGVTLIDTATDISVPVSTSTSTTKPSVKMGIVAYEVKGVVPTSKNGTEIKSHGATISSAAKGSVILGDPIYETTNIALAVSGTNNNELDTNKLASGELSVAAIGGAGTKVTLAYKANGVEYPFISKTVYDAAAANAASASTVSDVASKYNATITSALAATDGFLTYPDATAGYVTVKGVANKTNYNVSINDLSAAEAAGLKAGTSTITLTASALDEDDADITGFGDPTSSNGKGIYKWSSSDDTVLKVTGVATGTNFHKATAQPLKAGTVTVTFSWTSEANVTYTATKSITVAEANATIKFVDKDGKVISDPEFISTYAAGTNNTNTYYVAAVDKNNNIISTGGFTATTTKDGTLGSVAYTATDSVNLPGVYTMTATGSTNYGKDTINLMFTASDSTVYYKEMTFKTYRKVIYATTGIDGFVVKGTPVYNEGTTTYDLTTEQFVKVYSDDAVKTVDPTDSSKFTWTYTVDVSDYKAVKEKKDFNGWILTTAPGGTHKISIDNATTSAKTSFTVSNTATYATDNTVFNAGDLNVQAYLVDAAITNVSGIPSTIVKLNDNKTTGTDATTIANIELGVTPYDTDSQLTAIADDSGILILKKTTIAAVDSYKTPAVDQVILDKGTVGSGIRTDILGVGMVKGKAGKTTVHITNGAAGDSKVEYGSFEVAVSGAKYDGANIVGYYDENGELLKNTSKVIGDKTYYFGDDGKVVTNGIVMIDGKLTLIAGGVKETAKGLHDLAGKTYCIKDDGTIASSELTTVSGKQYYFRADGTMVKSGDADVKGGKFTDPKTNVTYVIAEDNTAKPDKKMVNAKFEWTTKKPAKFQKGDPAPTNTWEITYNLEGETTKQTATGSVTAVADPAGYQTMVGLKEVTFTFTASESDLAGFFSDSKGEKALTASPAVWTYRFSGSSDIGTGGGIEIQGFEEGQEFKFTGSAIKPAVEVWDNDLGVKLTLGVDYSLSYKNNTKITTDASKTPVVTVNGKGNYVGKTVTRTFKIVDPREGATDLTATVKKIELGFGSASPVYNGEPWYPESITVDGNAFQHSSGEDYTTDSTANYVFSFSNNTDAGTATVGVTGQDGKTKKKTFKIAKVDLSKVPTANLEISPADTDWAVKGAVPATTVTYTPEGGSAITLVEGQDYTLKVNYADRKKNVADNNTVTITGKGTNFAKKATSTETFKIEAYTLSNANILEVVAPAGAKVKAVKATVVDGNGVKINKKDYTVNVYDSEDTVLAPTATLTAGSTYKVEVVAPPTGNIAGSGSFEFIAAADMSKAKVTLSKDLKKNGVAYTGEPIDITAVQNGELIKNLFETDITVEYKNPTTKKYEKLTYDEDFEVLGYQNNVKKGNMTVYIRAKDDSTKVSGVKYFKIKISAKTMKKAD